MSNPTDFSRLFFALWPDKQTRQKLAKLNNTLEAKGFRPVQSHNFHVTLVFLGNLDSATESLLKGSAESIFADPFVLKFDQLSYWSRPRILCLTCSQWGNEVENLVVRLTMEVTRIGLQTDDRAYKPHITLARHAGYLPKINFDPIEWRAESFCLVESCSETSGVCYKVKQTWAFSK